MITPFRSPLILILSLAAVLAVLGGCRDEESPVTAPPAPSVEPETPEALLTRLLAGYEARDKADYLSLLDPDFLFVLRPETTALYPELGPALDYAEEERIHTRMFSGEDVVDPEGNSWPAVQNISFPILNRLDDWTDTDDAVQFPSSRYAVCDVELAVDCGASYVTYQASGHVKIYVREHKRMDGTEEVTLYKLAGMVDLTRSDKGVERTPWGLIKAFYR